MKPVKLSVAVALVLAAMPLASFAQDAQAAVEEEAESPISWSVAATSDYTFRGVSQTDEKPALQASITYTAPIGFYVGAWASNVDFGDDTDAEIDTYIGYNTDLGDEFVNLDVLLNRYNYVGGSGSNDLAYNELITKLTVGGHVNFTVGYTNDVYNSGEKGWYYAVGGDVTLPWDLGLSAGIGHSTFDGGVARDYTDYSVTLSKSWGAFTVGLGYVGTNNDGAVNFGKLADDRAVLTVTYEH
ncbi:MAG: TorF family putative porin [Pseudoxanthomonas sp.]